MKMKFCGQIKILVEPTESQSDIKKGILFLGYLHILLVLVSEPSTKVKIISSPSNLRVTYQIS